MRTVPQDKAIVSGSLGYARAQRDELEIKDLVKGTNSNHYSHPVWQALEGSRNSLTHSV